MFYLRKTLRNFLWEMKKTNWFYWQFFIFFIKVVSKFFKNDLLTNILIILVNQTLICMNWIFYEDYGNLRPHFLLTQECINSPAMHGSKSNYQCALDIIYFWLTISYFLAMPMMSQHEHIGLDNYGSSWDECSYKVSDKHTSTKLFFYFLLVSKRLKN